MQRDGKLRYLFAGLRQLRTNLRQRRLQRL
jgi:hypothetical protein